MDPGKGSAKRNSVEPRGGGDGQDGTPAKAGGTEERRLNGAFIAAVLVATVASNIIGARYYRKMMADQAARSAQRKEAERVFRAARDRATGRSGGGDGRARQERARADEDMRERMRNAFGGSQGFGDRAGGAAAPRGWVDPQVARRLATLGIEDTDADEAEIKAAFRARALRLHPDRNRDSAGAGKEDTEKEFKRVAEAYAWLEENYFGRTNGSK